MAAAHRCRSCLWFAEPLWPEHRPSCMWHPPASIAPPWVFGRHYVTAAEAEECNAWEALACAHDWEWRVDGSVCKVCGIEQREAFKHGSTPVVSGVPE